MHARQHKRFRLAAKQKPNAWHTLRMRNAASKETIAGTWQRISNNIAGHYNWSGGI